MSVALHAESVDRNHRIAHSVYVVIIVALHAESVDRNIPYLVKAVQELTVALHAESVDRNLYHFIHRDNTVMSLSMRRAWIEIKLAGYYAPIYTSSLSMRRAWIEIYLIGDTEDQ